MEHIALQANVYIGSIGVNKKKDRKERELTTVT